MREGLLYSEETLRMSDAGSVKTGGHYPLALPPSTQAYRKDTIFRVDRSLP
jgi:hypothetical protein